MKINLFSSCVLLSALTSLVLADGCKDISDYLGTFGHGEDIVQCISDEEGNPTELTFYSYCMTEEEMNNMDSHSNIMNTPLSQSKQNYKSSKKKNKSRRSRLTIDPEEDFCVQHSRKVYTEEEKIKKAIDNSIYFNS